MKSQTAVGVKSYKVVDIESSVQKKDNQWAITVLVVAGLARKPKVGSFGNRINEVVEFTKKTVPSDFAWWTKSELKHFLKKFD